jgi:hypothetical protein
MNQRRIRGVGMVGAAVLAALVVTACGGSSPASSSTTPAPAANVAATNPSGATGATGATRRTALAACLQRNGVTLPAGFGQRRFGASGASGLAGRRFFGATGASGVAGRRFFGATGASGPRGGAFARNSGFAAAIAKCGGLAAGRFGAGGPPRTGFSASSAQDKTEVVAFVACMKTHGVTLPTPNFSGTGSVFGTKVNQSAPAFVTAYAKCRGVLTFLGAPTPAAA